MGTDLGMSVLPDDILIDIVSRLSVKVVCKLKLLSKSWLSLISSSSEFKRLHHLRAPQRPSFLVIAKAIGGDHSSPALCIEEDNTPLEDFGGRKVVVNFNLPLTTPCYPENIVSCRDLMCFHDNNNVLCVYSPSTNQYLPFDTPVTHLQSDRFRVGLVYVASMKLYKIVKMEVAFDSPKYLIVRFSALTVVQDDEYRPQLGGKAQDDVVDKQLQTSSWEFISEHFMHSNMWGRLGNLIGVNGVVYTIIMLKDFGNVQVLSLGFEDVEDNDTNQQQQYSFKMFSRPQHHSFKIFSLPQAACVEGDCRGCSILNDLFQVKNFLCFPHHTMSSVDLWLLKDRNACPNWFKGYSISNIPGPFSYLKGLAYFPHPTATIADDEDGAAIDDAAAPDTGVFLFMVEDKVSQYDISTKEFKYLWQDKSILGLHAFSDNLYPLKNGLSCTRMSANIFPRRPRPPPSPYLANIKSKLQLTQSLLNEVRNPPQLDPSYPHPLHGPLPPQCYLTAHQDERLIRDFNRSLSQPPPPPPHGSFLTPLESHHLPPPQGFFPPPNSLSPPPYYHNLQHTPLLPPGIPPPPQTYSCPPLPHGSSLPPPESHPLPPPQGSLPPSESPPLPPPQSSLQPPYSLPPLLYYHHFQHTATWTMPHPPLPPGIPPPPPPPFNQHNSQYGSDSPDVKRRKLLHS